MARTPDAGSRRDVCHPDDRAERHGGHGAAHGRAAYWEQEYNLAGARAFLVVIASLAVFSLIIPNYTKTEPDPSQAPMKAVLLASITSCSMSCSSLFRRCGTGRSLPNLRIAAGQSVSMTRCMAAVDGTRSPFTWRCSS